MSARRPGEFDVPDPRRPSEREVLAALPDGLVVVDADRRVVEVNARAARLLGRPVGDLVGRPLTEALPLVDSAGRGWWNCLDPWNGLATRTGHRERLLTLPGRGHLLVTTGFLRAQRLAPVHGLIIVLRDTLAQRRSEEGTAELLSIVSHELRSPLTSIRSFSGSLLRRWTRFSDDQRRLMVETIAEDAERLSRLLGDLLDVSRLDARRLRITPRPVDIREAITGHVQRLVTGGHDRDRFAWAEGEQERREVWADADRLDQILANLLDNALRHGAGTVQVATRLREGGAEEPSFVEVTVSDDGPGIPEDLRAVVYEKFWHGSTRGSTGLGLYLVRGLVQAHGGSITIDDAESGGALFRFTLPAEPPPVLERR